MSLLPHLLTDAPTLFVRAQLSVTSNCLPLFLHALLAGFKTSALRKRFLPWYVRPYRVTKTALTSSLLGCFAEWTVTCYIDMYRQVFLPVHTAVIL